MRSGRSAKSCRQATSTGRSHATIYRAALDLYAKGEPVDAITLVDELERRGELEDIGGRVRINELAALVPATSNAGHYARIVREMATLRGLVRAGQEIARLGIERGGLAAEELVDKAEQVIFDLSQERVAGEFTHIEELLKDSFERITALYEAGADVTGIASGYRELDKLTSGFQPGNLIVVAARPSMGKSALGALRRREPRGPAGDPGRAVHARDVEDGGHAAASCAPRRRSSRSGSAPASSRRRTGRA